MSMAFLNFFIWNLKNFCETLKFYAWNNLMWLWFGRQMHKTSMSSPILNINTKIEQQKMLFIDKGAHHRHHHHHVVPQARISLTFSRHFSLSYIASGRSSGLHPISSQSCCMYVCMYVRTGRLFLHGHIWGYIGVHHVWACPCFSSSVLHVWFV